MLTEALLAEEEMQNESLLWAVVCPHQGWVRNWQGPVQNEDVRTLVPILLRISRWQHQSIK